MSGKSYNAKPGNNWSIFKIMAIHLPGFILLQKFIIVFAAKLG